jgi:hypothetical protein
MVARVALVLLLLAIAAQGLSGRRRLDWAAISDAPGSTWTGLLLISAAAFVAFSSLHALARMLRASRATVDDEPAPSIEGSRVTWYGYLAAAAVIAVAIFLIYLLVTSAVDDPVTPSGQGGFDAVGRPANRPTGDLSSTDKWALLGAVLAGAALAVVFAVLRRRAELAEAPEDDEEATEQAALAEAVAAAEVELDTHGDDTRAAIVAAYLAMERQLVASGTARQASDTPTDFLLRAIAAARVSRGAATRLTELFREARFSTHPMAGTAREDAARALARVADDLAHDADHHANPGAGSRG